MTQRNGEEDSDSGMGRRTVTHRNGEEDSDS